MTNSVKVKLQPLTAEAFKPYGQMLENKQPVFPEVDVGEGRVAIELKYMKERPETRRMHEMAIHFSYNQTYIPLSGSMVLVLAPAPRNREAGQAAYEFDYERVAMFMITPGHVVIIDKGVWHNTFWIGPQCTYINVTRKNPGEGTSLDGAGRLDLVHGRRNYVEFVNLEKRDNRVLELDLSNMQDMIEA